MLLGELSKKTKCNSKTLDRYVRFGLVTHSIGENGYRDFGAEAVTQVELIQVLRKKPFRKNIEDIKVVFDRIPLSTLERLGKGSLKQLQRFLLDKDLL